MARRRDLVRGVALLALWVIPITWVNLANRQLPGVGNYLNNQYRLSRLFPWATAYWSNYFIQVRPSGDAEWLSLPTAEYFRLEPFGHRTRLDRILDDAFQQPHAERQRAELAAWIAGEYERLRPEAKPIAELRFVAESSIVGDVLSSQPGPWRRPPLHEAGTPDVHVWIVSTHRLE